MCHLLRSNDGVLWTIPSTLDQRVVLAVATIDEIESELQDGVQKVHRVSGVFHPLLLYQIGM
jgi:hypothetical protein